MESNKLMELFNISGNELRYLMIININNLNLPKDILDKVKSMTEILITSKTWSIDIPDFDEPLILTWRYGAGFYYTSSKTSELFLKFATTKILDIVVSKLMKKINVKGSQIVLKPMILKIVH